MQKKEIKVKVYILSVCTDRGLGADGGHDSQAV